LTAPRFLVGGIKLEENRMPSKSIGIVYTGRRGEAIAIHFAKHGFSVLLFEIDSKRAAGYLDGSKKTLELLGLRGNLSQVPIDQDRMRWVSSISELESCDLLIEALHDLKPEKIEYAKKLCALANPDTPVVSHSYLSTPSELSKGWDDNSNFAVGYFYDVEYGATNVELVYHKRTRPEIIDQV
jgi:3-hydroxybutyryl-CoA dehydrogenase